MKSGGFLAACGTDSTDGSLFGSGHFGESLWYDIYRIQEEGEPELVERLPNPAGSGAGDETGEEKKPGAIAAELLSRGVSVIMARSIGPNVVKMRRKFAVAVSRSEVVADALGQLSGRLAEVERLLAEGEERGHMVLPRIRENG